LVLDAEIALDGKPLVGIGNSLSLSVEGPQGAIGTLLHDAKDPGGTGTREPTATPFEKKVSNLLEDPAFAAKVAAMTNSSPLTITERGNGVYRFQLNDTKLSGGYKFQFTLAMNGPKGPLRRIEEVMTQVEALPDPKTTTIAVSAGAIAGTYNVVITPLDRFGNYVGPGFDGRVKITLPAGQGKVASITDPQVDGTYLVQLTDVPAGSDPVVSVVVNEAQVASAPLSKLPTKTCNSNGGCSCGGAGIAGPSCLPLAGLALLGLGRRRRHRNN
jgi:uncharacterized protein (TIGR03382 family)